MEVIGTLIMTDTENNVVTEIKLYDFKEALEMMEEFAMEDEFIMTDTNGNRI